MKPSRLLLLVAASGALLFGRSVEAKPGWLTDYKQAQQEAKASNKLILVDFTGSDWCGWCIKLDKEVFSRSEFQDYASKNLILLEVDFPRRKPQPEAERVQNEQLAVQHRVQGFPTIIVLDGEGKKVGELSYEDAIPAGSRSPQATPEAFIASVERLRKR